MDDERDEQTSPHYHPIGITFHWAMAALVFFQLWWGWRTTWLDPGYDKADAYVVHAQIGVAILVIAFMRLGWRMLAPFVAPKLEEMEDLPGWQRFAAEAVHWGLYVMMIALPISGLVMMGATAPDTLERALWFSAFRELDFVARAQIEHWAETAHFLSVLGMMGLIAAHVGAALKHYFIDRDDVLARMIPPLRRGPDPRGRRKSLAAPKAKTANAAR